MSNEKSIAVPNVISEKGVECEICGSTNTFALDAPNLHYIECYQCGVVVVDTYRDLFNTTLVCELAGGDLNAG